jgi:hypothetical protein
MLPTSQSSALLKHQYWTMVIREWTDLPMVILAESMGKHWIASPVLALRRCSFPSIIVDAGSGESSLSDMMDDEFGLMCPKICCVL